MRSIFKITIDVYSDIKYSGNERANASSFEKAYNNEEFGKIIYKNLFGFSPKTLNVAGIQQMEEIPIIENSILATQLLTNYKEYKATNNINFKK